MVHPETTGKLAAFFDRRAEQIAQACTSCGRCVEICPVAPFAGLAGADPEAVVGGVLDVLRSGGALAGEAATWAHQCNGCGSCIHACPQGINPRTMLMLANAFDARQGTATPRLFRKMARAIRLMAAMQLLPGELRGLLRPPPARDVPVVFYLGCNAIRTPHVLFNAMYVLDALEIDYEVVGGPAACCGIIHSKWEGRTGTGGRVTDGTLDRFAGFRPETVLNWCPSCQLHLGETLSSYRELAFGLDHVTTFLVEREERLKARFTTPVELRVLLHAHAGMADLGENVARLLTAVPGLELVDTVLEAGYTCGGSGADRSPALKARDREETLRRAKAPDVDGLVTLYHSCHMQLAAAGRQHGFTAVNFTDILVRALGGTPREDVLEAMGLLNDWRAMVEAATPTLRANGIDVDPEELAALMPELLTLAEFRGGLEAFAGPQRKGQRSRSSRC